jgi:hypothetical protein
VPADGLNVANDSSGPSAVAAVRYRLDGQAGGTLTLKLASGSALTGTEAITACPIQGGFTAKQNGQWAEKPGYDPATCVIDGKVNADSTAFTFDVPATFASTLGDISILIAPAPSTATPFSLAFDKPADDSFTVTTQVDSPSVAPTPAPAYQPGSAVYTPPAASGSFTSPAAPTAPTTVAPAATSGGGQVAAAVPTAAVPASSTSDEDTAAKYAAVAMLLAIGVAFWWLASQPSRLPRLLGSVGGGASAEEAQVTAAVRTTKARGVGRFARHRDAPATPI